MLTERFPGVSTPIADTIEKHVLVAALMLLDALIQDKLRSFHTLDQSLVHLQPNIRK